MDYLAILGGVAMKYAVLAVFGVAGYFLASTLGKRLAWWLGQRATVEAEHLAARLEAMFKTQPLERVRLAVWASVAVMFAALGWLSWTLAWYANLVVALLGGAAGWFLPRLALAHLYRKRVKHFEDQLLDGLQMVSNCLRSGLSLQQGLDLVVKEMAPPINQEFGLVMSEHAMGTRLEDCLQRLADRVPSEDLKIVVNAILILRETGANLSEIFDTIVYTVAERRKVEGKIAALTADGVMQGIILCAMPFVLGLVLYLMNPGYMMPLLVTWPGWVLMGIALVMITAGALMIRAIVSIEV